MTGVDRLVTAFPEPAPAPVAGPPGPPPGLDRVRALVNTANIEDGTDEISSPEALAAWLEAHGLADSSVRLTDEEVALAREVREALRDLLGANAGHPVDPTSVRTLDAASAAVPLAVRFEGSGRPTLRPAGEGLSGALGILMADIAMAVADGTWVRLKTCASDTCRWAYWDASKNRSGTWCSMAVCGNRMKGRRYRRIRQQSVAAT